MAAPRRLGRGSLEAQSRGARATKRGLRAPCRVARRAVSAREGRGARGSGPLLDVLYEAAEMGALDAETGAALADVLGAGVGERAVQAQEGAQLGAQGAAQAGEEAQTRCQSFHLAVPCSDVEEARRFYGPGGALGLAEGRRSARWQDYDLYGHQLVLHQVDGYDARGLQSAVDGDPVPVPHFGCALRCVAGARRACATPMAVGCSAHEGPFATVLLSFSVC